MRQNDFDEIMKETELDSAKMILSLASELREKELELAALRSKSFEEIQRNKKATEAEFEALIQGQEADIRKRETEIARLMVETESSLWQKHQAMLEEAITKHRLELEGERTLLNEEIARKEREILEQKKNLRLEMETLFKKWETEREEDFKNERKTFIEELKLGRDTARREAEERAGQIEALWKEKLAQSASEMAARHELELEEAVNRARRERLAEIEEQGGRQSTELARKEQELHESHAKRLESVKAALEKDFSARLARLEADSSARAAELEEALKRTEGDLSRRQSQWEAKYAELKAIYAEKETALEKRRKETEDALTASERALSAQREKLENEFELKAEKLKKELARKEKLLENETAENLAELQERFAAREKLLEEREARIAAEREELAVFRGQAAETTRRRETEITKIFEDRFALFKTSMEEAERAKELELARKQEEAGRQFALLSAQKDAALARAEDQAHENEELKRLLAEKDAYLHRMDEQEQERASRLRGKLEEEFGLKAQALRAQLAAGEEAARKNFEERLRAETDTLAAQYRVKEAGLTAQRDLMNAQAVELETRFMEALGAKERENAESIKKALVGLNSQLETAREAGEKERAELRLRAEGTASALRAEFEARQKNGEKEHEQRLRDAEKQAFAAARLELEAENKKAEELLQRRIADLESRNHILDQNLEFTRQAREADRALARKLKEEIELITVRLDKTEQEKQDLIQEKLSQAKDLRLTLEKEFLGKLEGIEKNYMSQLSDALRRGEGKEKALQDEYFKKLALFRDEYAGKRDEQLKEQESNYLERESRLRAALEEGYKLKEKTLITRYEQMESNYESALSEKTMQLDNDRSMAESVARLKSELETRNHELNSKIAEHDRALEAARGALEASFAAAKKELEDDHRMKTSQIEKERAKLKGLLEQEQQLVADLQKREAALLGSYAAKEAAMIKDFEASRKRLEDEYQARLRSQGGTT
jgi:hypothetical protein